MGSGMQPEISASRSAGLQHSTASGSSTDKTAEVGELSAFLLAVLCTNRSTAPGKVARGTGLCASPQPCRLSLSFPIGKMEDVCQTLLENYCQIVGM